VKFQQHELLLIGGPHDGEVKTLTISGPTFRTIHQRKPGYSLDPTPVYAEYAIAKLACDNRLVGIFVDLVFRDGKSAERVEVES